MLGSDCVMAAVVVTAHWQQQEYYYQYALEATPRMDLLRKVIDSYVWSVSSSGSSEDINSFSFVELSFKPTSHRKQMRSNLKHTKCKGSPFSVRSTYARKKGVNTVMFKNLFELLTYHNQHTKASKEHGWYPRNTDGVSSSCVCVGGTKVLIPQCDIFCHNRTWKKSNLPLDLRKIKNICSFVELLFTSV